MANTKTFFIECKEREKQTFNKWIVQLLKIMKTSKNSLIFVFDYALWPTPT